MSDSRRIPPSGSQPSQVITFDDDDIAAHPDAHVITAAPPPTQTIVFGDDDVAANPDAHVVTVSRARIRQLGETARDQETLITLGYDVGAAGADGVVGRNTRAAIRDFRADHQLPPGDRLDRNLREGMREQMLAWQGRLAQVYPDLGAGFCDGVTGPNTRAAITRFQSEHGIQPADGTLNEATRSALQAATSPAAVASGAEAPHARPFPDEPPVANARGADNLFTERLNLAQVYDLHVRHGDADAANRAATRIQEIDRELVRRGG